MADIKVRVGQSDAVKVTSTGLRRSDIAFSVDGGTANVTELNVSGISSLNNLNLSGIATFKPNTFGISGIIINGINETIEVGTGITLTSNSIEVDGSADFESLIVSAKKQTVGHFTEFGGTAITENNWANRLLYTIESIWSDGLGGYWVQRSWQTLFFSFFLIIFSILFFVSSLIFLKFL